MNKLNKNERYQVVVIAGRPFLFTNYRIDRSCVPKGMYVYDVADAECDGTFARVQKFVLVNHWGTIIGRWEVPLEDGVYYPEEGSDEYLGEYVGDLTVAEYYLAEDEQLMAMCA